MKYEIICFDKYNISAVKTQVQADWLLFVENGAQLAEDAVLRLEKAVQTADGSVGAFELRQFPVDTARHTDPVTLEITHLDTAAFMVKRTVFEQVGGFDSHFSALALVDLSWRLRAAGYTLQACPQAVVHCETASDDRYEYIHGAYERLLLGIKWGRAGDAKAEFEQTLKTPRHFPGVRKQLAKLYAQHFLQAGAMKKFAKSGLYKTDIADFSPGFGPRRGTYRQGEITDCPLVSVVVRTHRRKEVLRHTLKCLRNKIYKNFEIVIVEDGENTAEAMVKADFADLNINYYATGKNVGRSAAGNIGMERTQGRYICFLDDDDFYYPDYIQAFVSRFEANPHADMLICGSMAYTTNIISTDPYEYTVEKTYPLLYDHITLMDMCSKNRVPMPCVMFRKKLYDQYGGMRTDLDADEDWGMWLKFMGHGIRGNIHGDDIHRALCLFGYPADRQAAREREERYRPFEKIMLYDENLVFSVQGSEIRRWEEYVAADIGHLKNTGALPQFMADLKPLGVEKLEYDPQTTNRISAKQINNYYYWLVKEYAQQ